jgi:acyltransferase
MRLEAAPEIAICPPGDLVARGGEAVAAVRVPAVRDARVDFVKGIAIVGVVLHHVMNRRFGAGFLHTIERVVDGFAWAVFAFIFVSGYLYGRSSLRRQKPVWREVADRGRRLLVPYVWLAVSYAVLFQLIQRFRLVDFDASHFPATLAGKLTAAVWLKPVGDQLYFFVLLFACSAVVMLSRSWSGTERRFSIGLAILGVAGAAWVLAVDPKGMPTTGLTPRTLVLGTIQFGLGAAYGRTADSRWWRWVAPGVVLAALGACVACGSWRPVHLAVPLALFVACGALPRGVVGWRPVAVLGVASATIFAFHIPFVLHPMLVIFHKGGMGEWLNVATAVCVTLLACVGIHRVLWRYQWCRWVRV